MLVASILILDPDPHAREKAAAALRVAGHDVVETECHERSLALLKAHPFQVALVDLTGRTAYLDRLVEWQRASAPSHGLRVVACSGQPTDAPAALRAGADDFLAKPIHTDELQARVELALRRQPLVRHVAESWQAGRIRVDDASRRVHVDGTYVDTAPREYQLLRFFAANPCQVYSREQLLTLVWQRSQHLDKRTVDVHVRRLRARLEPFQCDHYLQTIHGVGYCFDPAPRDPVISRVVTKPSHR
ncbi:MAG: response regulator transcription factor [Pseudomonadota bacterium]